MRRALAVVGVLVLLYGLQPYDTSVLAKSGGGGGSTTPNITTNITVVDSTGKLVGEVVGVETYMANTPAAMYHVALDPSLAGGDSSLVVRVSRNAIQGTEVGVYSTSFTCSDNYYFFSIAGGTLPTATFITTTTKPYVLYKLNAARTLSTNVPVNSIYQNVGDLSQHPAGTIMNCLSSGVTDSGYAADPTPISLDLTPPFSLVNP